MTATNMCSNFGDFRCRSPLVQGASACIPVIALDPNASVQLGKHLSDMNASHEPQV